ncbi:MAG: hypothetical protein ACXWWF_10830, partial [Nitrospira sp.]
CRHGFDRVGERTVIVGYNYPAPCNRDGNWIGPPDRQDHWPPTYATLWKELPDLPPIPWTPG